MGRIIGNDGGIELLFKPFTLSEVAQITGIPSKVLDAFIAAGQLPQKVGDDGFTRGFDIATTFAVFCVSRWLAEGCPEAKAEQLLVFLVNSDYQEVMKEVYAGRTFPALGIPGPTGGSLMIEAPNNRLGRELNLGKLNREFRDRLDREFPRSVSVPTSFHDGKN